MHTFLNIGSVATAFVFSVGVIYLLLDATIGKFKITESEFEWLGLQVRDFVFIAMAITIILLFFRPVAPY